MQPAHPPDPAEIDRLVARVSNWGRFGEDDERGTLNLVGDEQRLIAARTVTSGRIVSLARRIRPRPELDNPDPALHLMKRSGESASAAGFSSSSDWLGIAFHGFATTHLDALCHVMWKGRMYNGIEAGYVTTERGARRLSIECFEGGIVGRGVLLDAPRALRLPWLEPGVGLSPEDLEACERFAGVRVGRGDIVLVRTGRDARRRELGPHDPLRAGMPGLLPSCAEWLHDRDVAVLGGDQASDVMVPGASEHLMPIHIAALVAMGMPLIDNLLLEELAQACSAMSKWDFLLTVPSLKVQGGTGSPAAPIAVI